MCALRIRHLHSIPTLGEQKCGISSHVSLWVWRRPGRITCTDWGTAPINLLPELPMSKRTITVQVSKTIQAKQYEPVTVSVTETVICEDEDAVEVRMETYRAVTQAVHKYVGNEVRKYQAKQKDEE